MVKSKSNKNKSTKRTKPVKKDVVVEDAPIRQIATELANKSVADNLVAQRDRTVSAINRLADRVHSNAIKVQKTADREAQKIARDKVKAERDAKKTAKRQAKIANLKKQLKEMETALAASGE
jgi:hypothetical protein